MYTVKSSNFTLANTSREMAFALAAQVLADGQSVTIRPFVEGDESSGSSPSSDPTVEEGEK